MMRIEHYANGHTVPQNGHKNAHSNLDAIFQELATLRAQNRALKAKLPKTKRSSSTVERAIVDAHTILMRAFSGDNTGRVAMAEDGMSKRRWAWAVAFLRYAGIVGYRQKNWRNGLEFVVVDLAESISLLEKAATEIDTIDGYKRLRSLLRQV